MQITIVGNGRETLVLGFPQELSSGEDVYDCWNQVDACVSAGAWQGSVIQANLLTAEIKPFLNGLCRIIANLEGEVTLKSMESWIDLRIYGDGLGHFQIEGEIRDDPIGNNFRFNFSTDQTYLADLLKRIETYLNG